MDQQVAIIDLGTNTFHLMLAEWTGREYTIVHRERIAVKIGMGGINQGLITDQGIRRALEGLKEFQNKLQQSRVTKILAFGTSALRSATNGREVAALICEQTGIEVNIISGDEEATFIYLGVKKALTLGSARSLIVDIGGGSVEFIIGDDQGIHWKHSFDIGGQRMLERFQHHDPILPEEIEEINAFLESALAPLFEAMHKHKPTVLIGSSGTFDTLSEIHMIRERLPMKEHAPETPLTFKSFWETHDLLLHKDRAQRLQIPGMIEMRVDMIVVASCLIAYLLDHWGFQTMRVSSYSLKEGVLASLEK